MLGVAVELGSLVPDAPDETSVGISEILIGVDVDIDGEVVAVEE